MSERNLGSEVSKLELTASTAMELLETILTTLTNPANVAHIKQGPHGDKLLEIVDGWQERYRDTAHRMWRELGHE